MKKTVLLCFLSCCLFALSYGDTWVFEPKVTEKSYAFGKSRIVLKIDATKNQSWPEHTLLIYFLSELMAKYKNIGFQQVFASPENRYFVGLSNTGIPGTAFVIFDQRGNLIREEKHRFMNNSIYSKQSVTVLQEWYHEEDPQVEFLLSGKHLDKIIVNSSSGKRYNLLYHDYKYFFLEHKDEEARGR